MILTVDEVLMV